MGGLFNLVQRGGYWAGLQLTQTLPCCNKCNSPPINSQCTNFVLFDVALLLPLASKGLRGIIAREKEGSCAVMKTVWQLLVYLQQSTRLPAKLLHDCVFCVLVFCDIKSLISVVEFPDQAILVSSSVTNAIYSSR